MDNLDITSETTNFGFEASQRITIKYVGGTHTSTQKSNNHFTVTVPFTSFSHRLRSIQRSGGKITDVSITRSQLVAPNLCADESKLVDIETVSEKVIEPILEIVPEPEIHAQDDLIAEVSQPISIVKDEPPISETSEKIVVPAVKPKKQPASPKISITKKVASPPLHETLPAAIAEIETSQKPVAETKIKAKRSKTSTKPSSRQVIEPVSASVAIAEIVIAPEPVLEVIPEPVAPVPLAEPKKPKTSTRAKSGSGFNKTKN